MRIAVVVFPGSNCDHDAYHAFKHVLGVETVFVWHKEADLRGADAVVLPGGFSYGDYLRAGAIASRTNCSAGREARTTAPNRTQGAAPCSSRARSPRMWA